MACSVRAAAFPTDNASAPGRICQDPAEGGEEHLHHHDDREDQAVLNIRVTLRVHAQRGERRDQRQRAGRAKSQKPLAYPDAELVQQEDEEIMCDSENSHTRTCLSVLVDCNRKAGAFCIADLPGKF